MCTFRAVFDQLERGRLGAGKRYRLATRCIYPTKQLFKAIPVQRFFKRPTTDTIFPRNCVSA